MRICPKRKMLAAIELVVSFLLTALPASVQGIHTGALSGALASAYSPQQPITIPNRPATPLFEGTQEKQKTELHFDPSTHTVTLKVLVQDPNGYFIPNIHRENFAVYENGVRQNNVSVGIEHASISLGVLVEFGGRSLTLDREMAVEISRAVRQLQDELRPDDRVAVWKYSDKVEKILDLSQRNQALGQLFSDIGDPQFSETNFYDAIVAVEKQMRAVSGRKAILLISSGVDTFSKATYGDALDAARHSDTPIYVIALTKVLRDIINVHENAGALLHIDWEKVDRQLRELAGASGGRVYSPDTTVDLSATYDDVMENLRVRYVITYRSSSNADPNSPRTVRVELIDPTTGGPLEIVDQSGHKIRANVVVQDTYVPSSASTKK